MEFRAFGEKTYSPLNFDGEGTIDLYMEYGLCAEHKSMFPEHDIEIHHKRPDCRLARPSIQSRIDVWFV